jgi:hypothetical protein
MNLITIRGGRRERTIMYAALHKRFSRFFMITYWVIFLSIFMSLLSFQYAFAQPEEYTIEIIGDGVDNPMTFTKAELETMEQYEHVYSTVNTYPTKKWYTAKGVKLRELLDLAKIKKEEAQMIRFVSSDGYEVTMTVKELLRDRRYYFPGLKENHPTDGSIPGSVESKVEVEPLIALLSVEGSNDPAHMTDRDAPHLIIGQRAVTEQTCTLFLKYVSKIEVLTTKPEKWDAPKANIPDGTVVPEGTLLELFNKLGDADKIHYTTDGSTPTVESPMINWIAKRWHSLRPEDLGIVNSPFEINKDVIIKAKTIGPGKEDSEVVTFTFTVDPTGKVPDPTKIPGGPPSGITLDRNIIDLEIGGTFRLEATVTPYNATNKQVAWSSSDTSVATVDNNGLVTVVGQGSAVIIATTVDGNHKAFCVVNGPSQEEEQVTEPRITEPEDTDPLKEEVQEVADETEIEQQYLEEKDETVFVPGTADEDDGEPKKTNTLPDETSKDEQPAQNSNLRYLSEKTDMAEYDNYAFASDIPSGPTGFQSGRVFEMSISTEPIPLLIEQDKLHIYILIIFLILFLAGAGKRYSEYAKE